jgi:poly(3-hydroxybutyrate) depolymerase
MFRGVTCRVERRDMMGTKSMGSLVAITVLLVGMGMVSAGVVRQEIEFDERPVVLLLPENFDKGNGLLLLVLHLHAARGSEKAPDLDLDASGYRDLPGKYRVMVAAPRAAFHQTFRIFAWNSFFSLAGCDSLNADDVGFLNGLLDELLDTYPIDPQRVYIYGYSSGANMAHRMACSNAERFAGIVAGAGFTLGDPQLCAPSVPISVLQLHSKGDELVLFDGGNIGNFFADPGNSACKYPGAVELLTQWADRNGCVGELKFGKKPELDLTTIVEGKETTVNKVKYCPNGIDVELWSMEGVPHTPDFFRVGPKGIRTLAEKSWKFLRKHTRDNDEDD